MCDIFEKQFEKGIQLDVEFKDLEDFYRECEILESTGNKSMYSEVGNPDPKFVGLDVEQIKKSKYSYTKGLEKLQKLEDELESVGGSSPKYKWDDLDGDEMSMDRAYEQLPFLKKRIKKDGDSMGKFITLYIDISEPWMISYDQMLYKTKTSLEIVDYLEDLGFRVQIVIQCNVKYLGTLDGKHLKHITIKVPVKKFEDPVIKPLLLTTLSPWFFRYWIFRLMTAKFDTNENLGYPSKEPKVSTSSELYIRTGECLDEESMKKKLEEFKHVTVGNNNEDFD